MKKSLCCGGSGFLYTHVTNPNAIKVQDAFVVYCGCEIGLKMAADSQPENKNQMLLEEALGEARAEVFTASGNWPPFNSAHEGFAVLLEEVEELKAHVWANQRKRNLSAMRKEAVQVAAMAIRFAVEVCDEERGRK